LARAAWARYTWPGVTELDRTVAIKILPEQLASDPQWLAAEQEYEQVK
jgi:hypothetical protein